MIDQQIPSDIIVRRYASDNKLQKPEKTLISSLSEKIKDLKMLDIGVGGGRTTFHFSHLVKEYKAIDYSDKMIRACRGRFPAICDVFMTMDVRKMSLFDKESFDLILFSFNSIDYIFSEEERLEALNEIKRIGKKGGVFFFSSHNLQADTLNQLSFSLNPLKIIEDVLKFIYLRIANKNLRQKKENEYALLYDGGHLFTLKNFYIKPSFQIQQLVKLGFTNVKMFSIVDGKEITIKPELVKDPWVYYFCNF